MSPVSALTHMTGIAATESSSGQRGRLLPSGIVFSAQGVLGAAGLMAVSSGGNYIVLAGKQWYAMGLRIDRCTGKCIGMSPNVLIQGQMKGSKCSEED